MPGPLMSRPRRSFTRGSGAVVRRSVVPAMAPSLLAVRLDAAAEQQVHDREREDDHEQHPRDGRRVPEAEVAEALLVEEQRERLVLAHGTARDRSLLTAEDERLREDLHAPDG